MDTLVLEARSVTGKAVKHLRKTGIVPAVIHDHGKESILVQLDSRIAAKAYHEAGKHAPVTVTADGHTYTTLIKSVSFDPIYNAITHIVFNAVRANEKVEAIVPIEPKYAEGNEASPAERGGLIVLANLESVEIKALPKNLPDALYYDAEKLIEVGDHATVADLLIPQGVEVEASLDKTIATVYEPSALQAANDAAGGTGDDTAATADESNEAQETEGETKEEA